MGELEKIKWFEQQAEKAEVDAELLAASDPVKAALRKKEAAGYRKTESALRMEYNRSA
jgi:hypothetical protein